MKRFYIGIILMVAIPLIMGMGTGSGNMSSKIPTPDKNYSATIIDSQGVTTKVTQISFDGRTYLAGARGNTTVIIPFDKITSVRIGKEEPEKKVSAVISLKAGGTLNITVDGKLPCYGSADFGNVQIEFKDIKKVEIDGVVEKVKQ